MVSHYPEHSAKSGSIANAKHVLDKLMEAVENLSQFPERGSFPKELIALGIKGYRQVLFKLTGRYIAPWVLRLSFT